ncbi:hypothetical protein NST58_06810 [Paenibacillus sp. FSL R10-2796]|uniref:hypothetical protein n=1 Tax=Paenibacillus sp. FSL R10-2796 TaxID=2954663 RepID=UPI0030DD5D99
MINEVTFTEAMFRRDFNPRLLGHLKLAINHGYIMSNKCIDDNDFLKDFVGKRDRSRLQNTAVEFAIKDRAERFGLELKAVPSNNVRGSFPHYDFFTGKSIFTVSRTDKYDAFPRDADFRSFNGGMNSQIEMVHDGNSLVVVNDFDDVEKYYSILTFGGKLDVEFMYLGVPNMTINRWLHQQNIATALTPVEKIVPQKEEIAETQVAAIKDEFLKRKEVSQGE